MSQILVGTAANDGTGDPIRTAFQKVNRAKAEYDNVQYYGARGDGTTDDAAAFTAAIVAAIAGGGHVYIPQPATSYLINSTISVPGTANGLVIEFASWNTIVKLANNVNASLFRIEAGAQNVRFVGGVLEGNKANNTGAGTNSFGIDADSASVSGVIVEQMLIQNTGGAAVSLQGASHRIRECRFLNNGASNVSQADFGAGIRAVTFTDLIIERTVITNSYGSMIRPVGSGNSQLKVIGNTCTSGANSTGANVAGIGMQNTTDVLIQGNTFVCAAPATGDIVDVNLCSSVRIMDNYVSGSSNLMGIFYGDNSGTDCQISGNVVVGCSDGIHADTITPQVVSRVTIKGNHVINATNTGIIVFAGVYADPFQDVEIEGNTIVMSGAVPGISASKITDLKIQNNRIVGGNYNIRVTNSVSNCMVTGNRCRGASLQGILADADFESGRHIFAGNRISGSGNDGLYISYSGNAKRPKGLLVSENSIDGCVSGYGIRLYDANDVLVIGNMTMANLAAFAGIRVEAGTNVTITGNRSGDDAGAPSQNYGVNIAAGVVLPLIVSNNNLKGNTTAGYLLGTAPSVLMGNNFTAGAVQGRAVLVGGTVTVNTVEVIAADNILLNRVVQGGTAHGDLEVGAIVAGTSFVINAKTVLNALETNDTSTIFWQIVH